MCNANILSQFSPGGKQDQPSDIASRRPAPEDVPLGDGIASIGKATIMTRRERLRSAMEGAGA